jgi:2',3'-cyclic-nucleotide 2'-phosphodiesterase (5'-nucleotidase family)
LGPSMMSNEMTVDELVSSYNMIGVDVTALNHRFVLRAKSSPTLSHCHHNMYIIISVICVVVLNLVSHVIFFFSIFSFFLFHFFFSSSSFAHHSDFFVERRGVEPFVQRVPNVISTNLDTRGEPLSQHVKPSLVYTAASGLRIGVVSLYTSSFEDIDKLDGLTILNEFSSAGMEAVRLQVEEKVDLILLMAKRTNKDIESRTSVEFYKYYLSQLGVVSILVTDMEKYNPLVPVDSGGDGEAGPKDQIYLPDRSPPVAHVMCPDSCNFGKAWTESTVSFDAQGGVLAAESLEVPANGDVPSDPAISALLRGPRTRILEQLTKVMAISTIDLDGNRALCRWGDCSLGAALTKAMVWYADERPSNGTVQTAAARSGWTSKGIPPPATIGIVNSGFIRNSIWKNVTQVTIKTAFPFANTLYVSVVSGRVLFDIMSTSFRSYKANNETQDSFGGFLQVWNIYASVNYDSGKMGVVQVLHKDGIMRQVDHNLMYTIAANDFNAKGGDGYDVLKPLAWNTTGAILAEVFETYLLRDSPPKILGEIDVANAPSPRLRISSSVFYNMTCPDGWIQPEFDFVCNICAALTRKLDESTCEKCGEFEFSTPGSQTCSKVQAKLVESSVDMRARIGLWVLCSIMIVVCAIFAALIYIRRTVPIVKMSSPFFNYILAFGCAIGFTAVIVLGFESSAACMTWIWLLVISFTVVFGSLFVKIHRINDIFNNPSAAVSALTNASLLRLLAGLLAFDVVVLSVWTVAHPVRLVSVLDVDENVTSERCVGDNMAVYSIVLGALKFILVAWGVRLAFRTRSVRLRDMNESRFVALAIYNVVVVAVIIIPTLVFLGRFNRNVTATTVLLGIGIILGYGVVLALVIGTRIYFVFVKKIVSLGETASSSGNSEPPLRRRGTATG